MWKFVLKWPLSRWRQSVFCQTALGQKNDNFVCCPEEALEWGSRRYHIIEEIVEYCPDIMCLQVGRAETERDGTRAETTFGFSAKRTSPFISARVSVQSAAGSRGVRISGSNAG